MYENLVYDHFHAHIEIKTGKLAGKTVEIEGGFAQKLTFEEYMKVKQMPEAKRVEWMEDHVYRWLPEEMNPDDIYLIKDFRVAG